MTAARPQYPDIPHEAPTITGWQSLATMRRDHAHSAVRHAIRVLTDAEASRTKTAAFPIMAEFGETERTRDGYKNIDGAALVLRLRRLTASLSEWIEKNP
mgnify:CR=1 FL=1